jgi:hypothetical protein
LPEELPNVGDKEFGLFHCEKVATAIELCPVHDIVIAFGETLDRYVCCGGHRHTGWHF